MVAAMSSRRVLAAAGLLAGLSGCPADDVLTCAEIDPACTPQYEPTFANVYANTIEPKCAVSSACHAGASPKGGLDLSDPDVAHAALLADGEDRVIPGEPSCSEMIMRVSTSSRQFLMPPGSPLSEAERCALAQWVLDGAPGP